MNDQVERIVHSLHLLYQLPKPIIREAVASQFKFVHNVIARGDLESVRLKHLGLFVVKPAKKLLGADRQDVKLEEYVNMHKNTGRFAGAGTGSGIEAESAEAEDKV